MRRRQSVFSRTLFLIFSIAFSGSAPGAKAQSEHIEYWRFHQLGFRQANAELKVAMPVVGQARVIGGVAVKPDHFLEVVHISFRAANDRPDVCTGVLISRNAVLTAGHCGCGSQYRLSRQYGATLDVQSSKRPLSLRGAPILFPGFKCGVPLFDMIGRDLAILKIQDVILDDVDVESPGPEINPSGQLTWQPRIRPAIEALSDKRIRNLLVAGFGRTETGKASDRLLMAHVSLASRFCRNGYLLRSVCAMHREFVLANPFSWNRDEATDTCGGDSGGPAFLIEKPEDPSFERAPNYVKTLVGITSRALTGSVHFFPGQCGGGGVYTLVGTTPVIDWLDSLSIDYKLVSSELKLE